MLYSTFIVGFETLVETILKETFPNIKIVRMMQGGVIYQGIDYVSVKGMPIFNNHFQVLKYEKGHNIATFINRLNDVRLNKKKKHRTYRVIISEYNQLIRVDKRLLQKLETKISRETGNRVSRNRPEIEYWVLKRSEGVILFMERLHKHKSFDKILTKGELRSDVCAFMNYLSAPENDDVFLDPFCGSGAILKSRKKDKFNMLFGYEINKEAIVDFKKTVKKNNKIIIKTQDFFNHNFSEGFITKIVTDPPWGKFEAIVDIEAFYRKMLLEFNRILCENGRLVLLTHRDQHLDISDTAFELKEQYHILMSGQKTTVSYFVKR